MTLSKLVNHSLTRQADFYGRQINELASRIDQLEDRPEVAFALQISLEELHEQLGKTVARVAAKHGSDPRYQSFRRTVDEFRQTTPADNAGATLPA